MRTKEYRVELTDEERAELLVLVRRGTAAARTRTRAHILLAAGEDAYDAATAAALHVSAKTVERVRHCFAQAPPGDRLRWALDDLPQALGNVPVARANGRPAGRPRLFPGCRAPS